LLELVRPLCDEGAGCQNAEDSAGKMSPNLCEFDIEFCDA